MVGRVLDTTRIAGGPEDLRTDILIRNASVLATVLDAVSDRLGVVAVTFGKTGFAATK